MKSTFAPFRFLPLLLLLLAACQGAEERGPLEAAAPLASVDPFIGTGGHGHTYPGAALPFGMVQLSPDTRLEGWDGCSGYHYSDTVVYGFSHTHLSGTGVSDYGDVLLMPSKLPPPLVNGHGAPGTGYASIFQKDSESASPGYYAVTLDKGGIRVELTATERCGLHRYDFGGADSGFVVLDLAHRDQVLESHFEVVNGHEIRGYRFSKAWAEDQRVYFAAHFSSGFRVLDREEDASKKNENGEPQGLKASLAFENLEGKALLVKVGISAVDMEGARKNLEEEAMPLGFEEARALAEKAWSDQLGKIAVKGGSDVQQRIFYTALYHSCLAPNLFSDVDGRYRGMDGAIHKLSGDKQFTVFSLWDTFRATHPLLTILEPERSNAFVRTFLRQYEEGGRLPIWELAGNYTGCMIGYHAIPVITDAYVKGLRDYDPALALEAMRHSAELDWLGLDAYKDHGFIAAGEDAESVSKTLEYAYDDWCISVLAEALGESETAGIYRKRAENYLHLFDPETHFFRARMNGGWQEPFDPREVNFNFTEANAWQYSCFVPQNVHRLVDLHGGAEAFEAHLDSLFGTRAETTGREQADITGLIGQYAHGNEPSHHMAYLYAYVNKASKTQARVREILETLYTEQPDGLSGNEDCGQMSSWYVLSALGFYPVSPGSDEYVLGAPLFPEASVQLSEGRVFRILARDHGPGRPYVQSVLLNGEALDRVFLRHAEIAAGGELVFQMGAAPNDDWYGELPGLWETAATLPAPIVSAAHQTFTDTLHFELETAIGAEIRYSLDGSDPVDGLLYGGEPVLLDRSTEVRAVALSEDGVASPVVRADFYKIDGGRRMDLRSAYANEYAAGGDGALIDHLRGGPNFRTGRWQGYREDFEGIVALDEERAISRVAVGFLQDIKSWIWMPREVEIAGSVDGKRWEVWKMGGLEASEEQYGAILEEYEWRGEKKARYIRVKALQYGECPPWHLGAGGKTWIFMDEIVIE